MRLAGAQGHISLINAIWNDSPSICYEKNITATMMSTILKPKGYYNYGITGKFLSTCVNTVWTFRLGMMDMLNLSILISLNFPRYSIFRAFRTMTHSDRTYQGWGKTIQSYRRCRTVHIAAKRCLKQEMTVVRSASNKHNPIYWPI